MDRNAFSKILKNQSNKNFYSTVYYPSIPVKDSDKYVISDENTFLDILSFKYYRDVSLWWIIYKANNLSDGKLSVPAGIQLRIPIEIDSIIENFKFINKK